MRALAVWITLASVVGLVGVLATADVVWSLLARRTSTTSQVYHRPVTQVVLDVSAGDVTVQTGGGDEVSVQQRLTESVAQPQVRRSWQGDRLTITGDCPTSLLWQGCGIGLVLRVPADVAVDVTTDDGSVTVRDLCGPVRVTTATGSVTGTGLRSSQVDVRAGTGPVSLGFAAAPDLVRAAATSGLIDVELPADTYAVQATSVTGRSEIGVKEAADAVHRVELQTKTGDLLVNYGD